MKLVKGPDFPTGGIVVGRSGIRDAYRTGRGRIVMRARAHVEELRGGKNAIIVTELPYGVKKGGDGGVISKIADLVREKVITEVSDLQDYSDKTGMRIQIELKREAVPQVALNKLFKHTALQTTFGYNAVALVDGVPRTLSLLEFVRHYLDFQREVVTRRSQYELRKALARAHVLEGYLIALDNLDEVIQLIRASDDADEARAGLMERFGLSELQAQAILDLRLRALTGLERKRVEDEYADLQERISELRVLLGDESNIAALIKEELLELKEIYGRNDERRTEIIAGDDRPRARGHDRGGGHGHRDHQVRLHQAATRDLLPRAAPRRHRRHGDGPEGRGLHRASLRRVDPRLHPLLHDRGQGVPAQGARAPARLAAVEGPGDREPAPVPAGRGRAGGHRHPELRGGEVPRVRDAEGDRQEDGVRRVQHAAQGRRDHRDQAPRGRPAHRRAARRRGRRRADGLAARAGGSLPRQAGACDGPRHVRCRRHEAARGRRGDRGRHRRRRGGPPRRHAERLRQAHARRRLPRQGPWDHGRQDGAARREARAGWPVPASFATATR